MNATKLRTCLGILAALLLMVPSIGTQDVHAGSSERLMAANVGRLTIFRGSDLGTICYEVIVRSPLDPSGGNPIGGTSVGVYTDPPQPPAYEFPGGTRIFDVDFPSYDEVHTGCIGGLSQAVVTDIFANPGEYWYTATTCWELVGCGSEAEPFAPEGSACRLISGYAGGVLQGRANVPFDLQGDGFVPGSVAHITFTPDAAPDHPGVLDIPVTEYSTFIRVMAGRIDQIGDWTVTVTGPGGCSDTKSLRIYGEGAGPAFPAGATALPGGVLATGSGPDASPGMLPNTAMQDDLSLAAP